MTEQSTRPPLAHESSGAGSTSHYLRWYLGSLATLLLLVSAINFTVDPEGRFRFIDRKGFNHIKLTVKHDSRLGKTAALWECRYDVVLLGSSRIELGVRPDATGLPGRAYNAGLKSASLLEIERLGRFILDHNPPRVLVIGLDFFTFNERRISYDDFADSMLADSLSVVSTAKYLASLDTLIAAWRTVRWNRSGRINACDRDGYSAGRPLSVAPAEAFRLGIGKFRENPELYGDYLAGDDYPQRLRRLLVAARAGGVDVRLFISPMHAVLEETLEDLGLHELYLDWKRRLTSIVAEVNEVPASGPAVVLWDFSGYNAVTIEPVPADGSPLPHYRDPSHYKPPVGQWIINRLFANDDAPTGFGVRLTMATVEDYLQQEKRLADQYTLSDFLRSVP